MKSWKFTIGLTLGLSTFLILAASAPQIFERIKVKDAVLADNFYKLDGSFAFYTADAATAATGVSSATSSNTANTIVKRGASGEFSAGQITANVTGNVTGNVSGSSGSTTGNAATVTNGVYTTGSYSDPSWLSISLAKIGLSNVLNALQLYKNGADFTGITQGAVFYYDGSNWAFLPPGDSGKFLKTSGAAANPLWDTPAGTTTFTGLTDTFTYAGNGGKYAKVKADASGLEPDNPMALSIPAAAGNLARLGISGQVYDGDTLENAISTKQNLAVPLQAGNIAKLNIQGQIYDGGALAGGGDMLSTDYDTAGSSSVRMARGLKESGTQELTMGAVADGQYLKRSGATIISATPAGGGDMMVAPPSIAGALAKLNIAGQVYEGEAASEAATPSTFVLRDINAAVTAEAFYGDGTKLTGVVLAPASTTEDNVPLWDAISKKLKDGLAALTTATANSLAKRDANASITAEAFYGDGSHLTGVSALPSQTGNSGKYLTTNGSVASWAAVAGAALATQNYTQDFTINEALDGYTISNSGSTTDITGTFASGLPDGFSVKICNEIGGNQINGYTSLALHLDNNSTDSSLTPKTMTATGITYGNSGSDFKWGYGAIFDGTKVITTPADTAFNFGTGDFSISMWINPDDLQNGEQPRFILSYGDLSGSGAEGFDLYTTSTAINVSTAGGGGTVSSSVELTVGAMQHLAVIRSGSTITIYLNGVSVGSGANSGNVTSTGVLGVGRCAWNADRTFKGKIDELKIDKGIARPIADLYKTSPFQTGGLITLSPPSGGKLPGTSAINRNLVSSAFGDSLSIYKTADNFIGESVFPAVASWVDTAQ